MRHWMGYGICAYFEVEGERYIVLAWAFVHAYVNHAIHSVHKVGLSCQMLSIGWHFFSAALTCTPAM